MNSILKVSVILAQIFFLQIASAEVTTYDQDLNRYPEEPPGLVVPPRDQGDGVAPKTTTIDHPDAKKGLVRIEKDGSYIYRTPEKQKTKSGAFKFSSMTAPKISGNSSVSFESMYGKGNVSGILFDYEWLPFQKYGMVGFDLGIGVYTVRGNGSFTAAKTINSVVTTKAEEAYSLYILPISAFLSYKFEYSNKQVIVPYVSGGLTYYGLLEIRDDGKKPGVAGAFAAGGGGGLNISISRWSRSGSFALTEEYGVADVWITLEGRAMSGLNKSTDFTNSMVNLGMTVDF